MGQLRQWLPMLLMILLAVEGAAQIEKTMRPWKHREPGVCSGAASGRAVLGGANRADDIRQIYQNCTRIYGNVEITYLRKDQIGNGTFDWFDDIEEILGYVFIYATDIEEVSFKNLKIIWGENLMNDVSAFYIEGAKRLKYVNMPNLRTIKKGSIGFFDAGRLCNFQKTVNFNELVDMDPSRVMPFNNTCNKTLTCHHSCQNNSCWGPGEDQCQTIYRTNCPDFCYSKQCFKVPQTNDLSGVPTKTNYTPIQLNTTYTIQTKLTEMNGKELTINGTEITLLWNLKNNACCHTSCVGGCTGSSASDCIACDKFVQCAGENKQNCTCVDTCTSRSHYNMKTGQVEVNPKGFYSLDNKYCVKQCPENRLVDGETCVEHCSVGKHYNAILGDKVCRKCDGICPKSCKVDEPIDAENIDKLKNCTEIEGFLRLNGDAFKPHEQFDKHNKTTYTRRALRIEELNVLSTITSISEYVYIHLPDHLPITSLSFLENLKIIEGRKQYNRKQSLLVSNSDHLQNLGMQSLEKIVKGDVVISGNTDLCYIHSVNWSQIVDQNNTFSLKDNRDKTVCEAEGRVCSNLCDPRYGCWGKEPKDCSKCDHWRQDNICVEKCSETGYFEDVQNGIKTCTRCFPECKTCKGPLATDCLSCRNYELWRKTRNSPYTGKENDDDDDDDIPEPLKSPDDVTTMPADNTLPPSEQPSRYTQRTCVPSCPTKYFLSSAGGETRKCERCHRSCYELGCTGPSNIPGDGGCNMCKYAQVRQAAANSTIGNVDRCLYNSDKTHSNTVCTNNDLLDHFIQRTSHEVVQEFECAPCDAECATCVSKGTSRRSNSCKCRNMVMFSTHRMPAGAGGEAGVMREDERCVSSCMKGSYFDNSTIIADVSGVCRMCSMACEKFVDGTVCTGPLESDCTKCADKYFSYTFGDKMTCVRNCSELGLYTYTKNKSCNEIDYETREKIRHTALYIIGAIFIIMVIVIGCLLWRRQRRLSKELEQEKVANLPDMPDLIPMDHTTTNRINKERLNLIPKQALSRSAKQLGSGAFGVVYAGCWMPKMESGKSTKVPVAIKVVRDPSGRAQSEMLDEATRMTMLRHENLLRIVGVCLSGDDLQLVTLLRPLGNLREFLQKHKGNLSSRELLQYAYQISSGMKYLADASVVHRDLAARNVLVKNSHHVEITDFGLAKLIDIGDNSVQVGEGKVAIKWLALEALEKQVYNTATDVWAFGVTVWEILTYGESPYANMTPHVIKEFLLNGQRLAQPNNCSTELYKILIDCWLPNPDSRPTFAVIKEILYRYCRAPYVFIYDKDTPASVGGDFGESTSQRGLIEEILQDTDFEDPQHYFESEPNTPGCINSGDVFNPTGIRRMDSLGSQRYAQDPVTGYRKELSIVDDNYLVPNSHVGEVAATMYTPVVTDDSGNSCLVESLGYYNEVKPGSEYINDTKGIRTSPRDDRLSAIAEDDGMLEKESCL